MSETASKIESIEFSEDPARAVLLEGMVIDGREIVLDILTHSDQVPTEECKLKCRAFLKLFDERVKHGPQGPKVP